VVVEQDVRKVLEVGKPKGFLLLGVFWMFHNYRDIVLIWKTDGIDVVSVCKKPCVGYYYRVVAYCDVFERRFYGLDLGMQ